ncbi:ABC transporter ATP-binding protein [Micromonospora echinofusca]|uniref:ABC transporter ATP-binding protein n=1 Tax=Micromonospora echinofusca TaxID=47858 RepID=UPI00340BCB09
MLRHHDPSAGQITVGGMDLRDLGDADLRRTVTVVPQDVHLFPGSIADNIRLGRPDATDTEVRAAAGAAQLTPFLDALPAGPDTPAGERGAALSGGQRARVAVARALITGARVLVLDGGRIVADDAPEQLRSRGALAAAVRGGEADP